MDEFQQADVEAGAPTLPVATGRTTRQPARLVTDAPRDMMELRTSLVQEYHKGAMSLLERLNADGRANIEAVVMALVEEVVKETDNLLGNELLATQGGNLRDASVISFKRAEVLEKAIKAVQAKLQFERESGLDVENPGMITVFKYFMGKAHTAFRALGYDDEASDTFFRMLSESMKDWKKELKEEFAEANSLSPG